VFQGRGRSREPTPVLQERMTAIQRNKRSPRKNIVFTLALLLALYFAWLLREELMLLYVSALFAVVLMPVVQAVERFHIKSWRPSKAWAVFFLLVAIAVFLVGFGFLAVPPVLRDLQQLSEQTPRLAELIGKLHSIPVLSPLFGDQLAAKASGFAGEAAAYILVAARDWAGKIADLATGIVLTVYFILEGDGAYRWFLAFIHPENRVRMDETLHRAGARMGRWLLGQASLMLILGVCSTAVYALLHVRYAYALGVLTGLLNIIPVLGAAITIVLVLLIAAIDSWTHVVGVAIFYLIYLQVENSYLTPRIMQNRVNLPGLAILVALLLGFGLAGVLGALVAVPTAVLVAELLEEYMVWKDRPLAPS
jgi:predicted PurR-regulated permease PerM